MINSRVRALKDDSRKYFGLVFEKKVEEQFLWLGEPRKIVDDVTPQPPPYRLPSLITNPPINVRQLPQNNGVEEVTNQ